jgi:tetrapyrrole methylase family protein/MazG family protein
LASPRNNPGDPREDKDYEALYRIVSTLRGPQGCPWDREQTALSMRDDLMEECFECIDAIDNRDPENLKEELGDIFLTASLILRISEEEGLFSKEDVFRGVCQKLIQRHPHVFGDETIASSENVLKRWEEIKIQTRPPAGSLLEGIPKAGSPLFTAFEMQKKAAKAGFDWSNPGDVFDKIREEIGELEESLTEDPERRLEEAGDCLFSLVNALRFLKLDPVLALNKANRKFKTRFNYIEEKLKEKGLEPSGENFSIMEALWEEAKKSK